MAMTKIVSPQGWDWDQPITQIVKSASHGLRGDDKRDFLKTAAPVFADAINSMHIPDDVVPVHTIAMGATEAYSANRNGDGFKEAMLKRCHPTFVKHARMYRNHANTDPAKSYGVIKLSAYNDAMRRVELLAFLNAKKSAADRNGGLVADKEIAKLEKDGELATSMAIRVPHDVCSSCENKAKNRSEYCTEDTCVGPKGEKRGGCKHNLAKVAADGHYLHVDNPDGVFFDESYVFRPADRIAYGGVADYLQKAASAVDLLPGAEAAELLGVTAPIGVILDQDPDMIMSDAARGQVKLAYGLAYLEQNGFSLDESLRRAMDPSVMTGLPQKELDSLPTPRTKSAMERLAGYADQKIILSPTEFATWLGKAASASDLKSALSGVYSRLADNGNIDIRIRNAGYDLIGLNPYVKSASDNANIWQASSLDLDAVATRSMQSAIRGFEPINVDLTVKRASVDQSSAALAEEYALYKLAALHRIASFDKNFDLTTHLALVHNLL